MDSLTQAHHDVQVIHLRQVLLRPHKADDVPHERSVMPLMARAAKQAGAKMIRTSSVRDIIGIKEETGLDVIAEWNRNPEVKRAVINGEMDFYRVAKQMQGKKRPPSPMRSPNGVNGVGPQSITSMSDAQFKKLDKMLDQEVRFTIRR